MSSKIRVSWSAEKVAEMLEAMPPEDFKKIVDAAMCHLVDDFMECHHILVSLGAEVSSPCSVSIKRKPVSPCTHSNKAGADEVKDGDPE